MRDLVEDAFQPALAPYHSRLNKALERLGVNPKPVVDLPFLQRQPATFAIEKSVLSQFFPPVSYRSRQFVQSIAIEVLEG